jgi:hypothetical protein
MLAVNWGSLYINVPIEGYHPRFYRLIAELNQQKRAKISRSVVRERIAAMVGGEAGPHTGQVVDAIEARMVEERLLLPQPDQNYRPGFQKRLRIGHVFVGGLTLLYIFNPGFGMIELIPDNIPIFGNLDEVGLGVWVFSWLYKLYRDDRREALGDYPEAATPPQATAIPHGPAGPALPKQSPTPMLPQQAAEKEQ